MRAGVPSGSAPARSRIPGGNLSLRRRFAVPLALIALLAGGGLLLLAQPHAQARHLRWKGLNKIQRRIISQSLANYIGAPRAHPAKAKAHAAYVPGNPDGGGGADGA